MRSLVHATRRLAIAGALAVTVMLAAGQTAPTTRSIQPAAPQAGAILAPAVDHHTHVWSLKASQLVSYTQLPPIELPADLQTLLDDREELVKAKDYAVLAPLYTEDAVVLDAMAPIWLQGKEAVTFVAQSLGSFPMTPLAYSVDGNAAHIAGTYTTGEADKFEHLSNFLLVLRKGLDGKWRIAAETFTPKGPPMPKAATAEQLVAELDAAGIQRAAVLSVAYWFGGRNAEKAGGDEYANVRAENDWVGEQVAKYPDRLVALYSFNPLKDYAVAEIERAAGLPHVKGLKLHLGNSRVDVRNPEHAEKLRAVFRAANEHRLPIVIHLWTVDKDYGASHSEALLNEVLPAAPDVVIQIAHMGASGPGYHSDEAFEVFARAAEAGDPRMKNVYTDVASMVTDDVSDDTLQLVAKRLRQFGLERVLFGSDRAPGGGNETPKDAWSAFLRLPFTPEEFRSVAGNVAPYMR